MEPDEYTTLFEQEERFWWYRGLRRLARDQAVAALRRPAGRIGGGAVAREPGDAGGVSGKETSSSAAGSDAVRILDAGCGTGGTLAMMDGLGRRFGIDFHPLAVRHAARRGLVRLCRGSVTALPYRGGSFDLIVSLDVLYHRGVESDLEALREFLRCLKPGGAVVLNLPAFESLRSSHDMAIHTARRYRRGQLERLIREAGLVPERITYWNTILFPGLAAVRLLRRRRNGCDQAPGSDVSALHPVLNTALGLILEAERRWLRIGSLPFGLSLLAVARKPDEGEACRGRPAG